MAYDKRQEIVILRKNSKVVHKVVHKNFRPPVNSGKIIT